MAKNPSAFIGNYVKVTTVGDDVYDVVIVSRQVAASGRRRVYKLSGCCLEEITDSIHAQIKAKLSKKVTKT